MSMLSSIPFIFEIPLHVHATIYMSLLTPAYTASLVSDIALPAASNCNLLSHEIKRNIEVS